MPKTHAKKVEARDVRLKKLPRSERLAKMATIKKKEGRVLDASEKHALKMTTEYGEIMRLWETLRNSTDPNADQEELAARLERKKLKDKKRREKRDKDGKHKTFGTEQSDDESSDDEEAPAAVPAPPSSKAAPSPDGVRAVERYVYKYPTIDQLSRIIAPKFATLAKTPRVSRVLQSMIKYGSLQHLEKILSMLSTDFVGFCNDAFSHFTVCALIRHAPHALYKKIVGMLVPNLSQLVSHKFGVEVVHAAYSSRLCSSLDRNLLLLGVFKDSVALMKHWRGYPVLEDILELEVDHNKRLIQRLFDLTDKLVSQKEAFRLPFVQRLVHAFMKHGTKHEIMEMAVTLKPHLAVLMETKEGSELAALAFAILEPKARKDALRAVGENLSELMVGKHSAPVVARLFDLMYDAQLLHKYVAAGIEAMLPEAVNSPYGHLILIHLLTPEVERRERQLPPWWTDYNLFSLGNSNWNTHTWLNVDYKKETVEICNKPAQRTHLSVLGPIVRKFIALVADEATRVTLNKTHMGVIARELLHVNETMPMYATSLNLSAADVSLLTSVLPNKDQKRLRETEVGAAPVQEETPAKKKRSESKPQGAVAATPSRKAPSQTPVKPTASPSRKELPSASKGSPKPAAAADDADDDAPVERSARAPVRAVSSSPAGRIAAVKRSPLPKMKK